MNMEKFLKQSQSNQASSQMSKLVDKLNEASEAYYNHDFEIMSNLEYDNMFDDLKELEASEGVVLPNSPTINVGAPVSGSLPRFKHPYPALSLDKTKDADEFQKKFLEGIYRSGSSNDRVVLMWKEDGATVQAYYTEGKLDKLVTRGNGKIGYVITHNAQCIKGLPLEIPYEGELVVRGEAVMSYEEFNRINDLLPDDEKYRNPRNLASGTLSILDSNESSQRELNLKAFNLVYIDGDLHDSVTQELASFSERLFFLQSLGFSVVEYEVTPVSELKSAMETMTENAPVYPFPVDGLVAAMDNYEYSHDLEGTDHHPNIMQGYAFKWSDETYETVLREIEWSPSRTGLLNPVAIFDPVEIDGTIVQRASVHNLSVMRQLNLKVGDRIKVIKANLVIPQVVENLDKESDPDFYYSKIRITELIGSCPTCRSSAVIHTSPEGIDTVYCPNPECPEKIIGKIAHFCERDCMDIQGMSEETIRKLYNAGFIREYSDLFNLRSKPGIQNLSGFGYQSWDKLCSAAESASYTTFVKFITAIGIPNIGKGQAKTLYRYLSDNYENLCSFAAFNLDAFEPVLLLSYLADMRFDFSKIEGFGGVMSKDLTEWIVANFKFNGDSPETRVYKLLKFEDKPVTSEGHSSISGKSICITGKLIHFNNRQELVAKIESLGGRWVDSVSKNTDYLINNDTMSTSGKNKKAKELNIPIISEEEFLALIRD